jgi:hypothetical protein
MIIQTDIEKEPDNILFSFMILKKTSRKTKTGKFPQLVEKNLQSPTDNIIHSDGRLNIFLLRLRTRQEGPLPSFYSV